MKIDLNCDLGESFGAYQFGYDEQLLDYVSSANVACGFHAGDPSTIRRTVELCLEKGVAVGAHPGLPDLVGFGRRMMAITADEAYDMTIYQCGAVQAFVAAAGGKLHHVKPHGALYHLATHNREIATAIAQAVRAIDPELILYGPFGSQLVEAGHAVGLTCAHEGFIDRTYQADGSLTPRSDKKALIASDEEAIKQALHMVQFGSVRSVSGEEIALPVDTLCLHGDSPQALSFAEQVKDAFAQAGIEVKSV